MYHASGSLQIQIIQSIGIWFDMDPIPMKMVSHVSLHGGTLAVMLLQASLIREKNAPKIAGREGGSC